MGANTHTNTYAHSHSHSHAYSYTDTYSHTYSHTYSYTYSYTYTYSYSYSHTISFFYHNVDPAYNVDGDPFDYFGQNDQFISTINFINADHHILNHYNRTLSF